MLDIVTARRIFDEQIVPDLLDGAARRDKPVVVFVVGQPGAGKSRTQQQLLTRDGPHGRCRPRYR
ncbi:zeta toxin family protein [Micromonospora sp. DT44]|uniref:zeta toxin family protein n=1 Tax=Micromonospora sp. DT44 TaxID=3393439 RepID=UPI003CE88D08